MRQLGLYFHIPFCRSKCLYCDFCSFPNRKEAEILAYCGAMEREIESYSCKSGGYTVNSAFFGGGTPTILPQGGAERLLKCAEKVFSFSDDAEITIECNPKVGDYSLFSSLKRAGFNRISIGLQSIHPRELQSLGRLHDFSDFCRTFADARRAGFENISVDVMSGIPGQTRASWLETLSALTDLAPEHISAYGLIVEEGTPFFRMGERLILPDEEETRAMYLDGIAFLSERGYRQYEISNFAKPGYESRHNLKYWNCDEYLGFGVAAYSDFSGARFGNSRDLAAYIGGGAVEAERETPSKKERENEYVMLRLRLCEGISAGAFEARFGEPFAPFAAGLGKYLSSGFVKKTGDRYAFTPEGMYVSNAILSEVVDFSG